MGETQVFDSFGGARQHLLDLRSEIVSARQVEAHRPAAPAAIITVTLAESQQALRVLSAAELPRVDEFDDDRVAHTRELKRQCLPSG